MKKIGILGGGQLGQMTIPFLKSQGAEVWVMDPNPECSCKDLADHLVIGDFQSPEEVFRFSQNVDVLSYELEKVSLEGIQKISGEISVFPRPKTLEVIQDKSIQKRFLCDNNFPTADFKIIQSQEEIQKFPEFFPCVQKVCIGGYDGKGVSVLSDADQKQKILAGFPSILESLVDIDQELSVIVARDLSGNIESFPPVIQEFDPAGNLVRFVMAPAQKISAEILNSVENIAKDLAKKLDLVGILSVEFFVTRSGEVLVNEMAPRVHNSGHWSIEGANVSQFEQWGRILLGMPLKKAEMLKPSVMVNLVGEPGAFGTPIIQGRDFLESLNNVVLHWYQKPEVRPFRKMGHITVTAKTLNEAKKIAEEIYQRVKVQGRQQNH